MRKLLLSLQRQLYAWCQYHNTLICPFSSSFFFFFLQTVFIISVCNNQLLSWIENELIWIFSLIPGFASVLPNLIVKLNAAKDKYMNPVASNMKVFNHPDI
jgi:hypothetical protein